MRAVVTGAGGFVGGNLVNYLAARGWEVIAVMRSVPPVEVGRPLPACRVEYGDIRADHFLSRIVVEQRPDIIFHLAAHAIVGEAVEEPMHTIMNNVGATTKVLEVVRRHPGPKVVLASTDKVFGNLLPGRKMYSDDQPYAPSGPYDVSKAACDLVLRAYRDTFGVPAIALRPCNIYGPGDRHLSRLVPKICRAIVTGDQVRLYASPTYRREYLYVDDACAAYEAAAVRFDDLTAQPAWNVASGVVCTPADLIEAFEAVAEFDMLWQEGALPCREVADQQLDGARFVHTTGWSAKVSLTEGLRRTLDWWRREL